MGEVAWTVVELLGLACVVAGSFLLLGLGPALIVAGALGVAVSLVAHRAGPDQEADE